MLALPCSSPNTPINLVVSFHEELLAEINERIEELHDAEVCDGFIHALRAVVELHRNVDGACWECQDDIYHKYPCPTIRAIEKELK